uniref:Uncharacterized protein n=1 Tax=Cyprinus carpio TaxID=7962 RepID=A0A8C1GL86_CYPCA
MAGCTSRCRQGVLKLIQSLQRLVSGTLSKDNIDDELEMTMVCHRPEGLEQLEAQTNFTKQELQVLYRGFKNECPSGVVNEETFKHIYAQFFPHGDASTYAHYLFNAFDTRNDGSIKFEVKTNCAILAIYIHTYIHTYIYTVQVKSLETLLFLMFLKEVSSAHQACIYLIKNTEKSNIVIYYYNLK